VSARAFGQEWRQSVVRRRGEASPRSTVPAATVMTDPPLARNGSGEECRISCFPGTRLILTGPHLALDVDIKMIGPRTLLHAAVAPAENLTPPGTDVSSMAHSDVGR